MSLNLKKQPKNSGNFKREYLEDGAYPGRLVQIIDLGNHPNFFNGEPKGIKRMVWLTYELVDAFMHDEEGNELEDKPRWISEEIPLSNLDNDKAKSTKRYNALDPAGVADGDFTALVTFPCIVSVTVKEGFGKHTGKKFENIVNVSTMRSKEADKLVTLKNNPVVFTLDEPDMEVFNKLPDFLKDKIKANVEFEGSALQKALEGNPSPGKGEAKGKAQESRRRPPVKSEDTEDNTEGDDIPW